jgi:23S rRNA maturation mini-RNase III
MNQYNERKSDELVVSNLLSELSSNRINKVPVLLHNTTDKKYRKWTKDEDKVIIHVYKKNPKKYFNEATEYLSGRSKSAIIKRWNNYLKKKNFPNLITRSIVKWTQDEDEIIIREYEKNPNYYSKNAAKHLTERSEAAIILRLNKVLKNKHIHNSTVKSS